MKYDVFGPGDALVMEAGVPVAAVAEDAGSVAFGVLPGGRYVTVSHHGAPPELGQVTADLMEWAAGQDLTWDADRVEDTESWGARLEVYNTNPADEPDWSNWDNDLLLRLAE